MSISAQSQVPNKPEGELFGKQVLVKKPGNAVEPMGFRFV